MTQASVRKIRQLKGEVTRIKQYLDSFEPAVNGRARTVQLGSTAEFLIIRNFPLPDGYRPDYIDMLVMTDAFPAIPPIGIYVLNSDDNASLIKQLSHEYSAFENEALHDAPAIRGYTWICYHYTNNTWRYQGQNPTRGDNISKFLAGFFAELSK